jgi:hypothetical protein
MSAITWRRPPQLPQCHPYCYLSNECSVSCSEEPWLIDVSLCGKLDSPSGAATDPHADAIQPQSRDVDTEEVERLKSLGYVN